MEQPITPEELERLKKIEERFNHRREVDEARQRRYRATEKGRATNAARQRRYRARVRQARQAERAAMAERVAAEGTQFRAVGAAREANQ